MVAFFRQARDDLAMRNVYREGVDVDPRDGYVFTVLIPVLTFVFKHIQSHNFGAQLIVNSIRTDTEKIIALLYKLGTEVDIFDWWVTPPKTTSEMQCAMYIFIISRHVLDLSTTVSKLHRSLHSWVQSIQADVL